MQREKLNQRRNDGRFKPGNGKPPGSGRKPGMPNKVTQALKEAALVAAASIGTDTHGTHGLAGYCRRLALRHPEVFATAILARILPMQVNSVVENRTTPTMSLSELKERLRERGLPVDGYDMPLAAAPSVASPPGTRH